MRTEASTHTVEVLIPNHIRAGNMMELLPAAENRVVMEAIAHRTRTRPTVAPSPRNAQRTAPTTNPEVAKTAARVRTELQGGARTPNAADSGAAGLVMSRVALAEELAAIAAGPPAENSGVRDAEDARRFAASDFELFGRTVTPAASVRHVFGLDYDDADAVALEAQREVARSRKNGIPMQNDTAVARVTAKRTAHARDRGQILGLREVYPEHESLIVRSAADTECTFATALERVNAAVRRAFALTSAAEDANARAVRLGADLASTQQTAVRASKYVSEQAKLGNRVSAAEAVAFLAASAAE